MKFFLSFLVLLLSYTSYSQVVITGQSSCTTSTLTATLTGSGTTTTGLSTSDDSWSARINLGFTYNFYGSNYTQCIIGTNGEIGFDLANANSGNSWTIASNLMGAPAAGSADITNLIAGVWCDLLVSSGGNAYYSTVGTAPNRKFEVTFCGVAMYNCTTQYTTSQIIIYETSNIAEVHIGHKTICTSWNPNTPTGAGGRAVVGVVNSTNTAGTTAPGRDWTPVWQVTTPEAWRFTPNTGSTAYTVTTIPYSPIPTAGATIYWYDSTTHAYLGSGANITVSPTVPTTYIAVALNCKDSIKTYYTLTPGGAGGISLGNPSICQGSTVQLSSGSTGGTWSSVNPGTATVNSTGLVTGVSGGTATISYTAGPLSGCSGTALVTVIQPGALAPATVCAGGTITLSDSPAGGTWTSSTASIATIDPTTGVVSGVSPGNTVITYGVAPGCTTTGTVTVNLLPAITGAMILCQNATTTLADAAPGGTWVSGNGTVAAIGVSSGIVTGLSGGNAPITYSIPGGCRTTAAVTVNPILPISGNPEMCLGFTTTLSNAQSGGTWSSSAPATAMVNPVTGVVLGASAGTATISYTSGFGCIATYSVIVHPKPAPPVVAATGPYCQFFSPTAQLVATGGGPTYTWYGPGVTAGYHPGPNPGTAVAGTDSFYVNQTSAFGCVSDSTLVKVVIKAKPDAPVTHPVTYCQNDPTVTGLNHQTDSVAGSHLNYYNTAGFSLGTAPYVPPTVNATYPNGTDYYISQTVNGCESDSTALNVDVVATPISFIQTRGWVCQFDSLQLSYVNEGSPLVNGMLRWTLPRGTVTDGITTLADSSIFVTFDTVSDSNIVTLVVGNLGGRCSDTVTRKIDVVRLPSADAYSKADVCMSDTISLALSARSVSANDFVWFIDNDPLAYSPAATIISSNSGSGGPFVIRWNDTGRHIIHVQAFAEHGCSDVPHADTVFVRPLPDASFSVRTLGGPLCLEDSVLFSANDSTFDNVYTWTPAHYFVNNNRHAEWGHVEQTQSIVTLTVTDPSGCIASSSTELDPTACCNVPFPNAFTPNGDGKNDVFRPIPTRAFHQYHVFMVKNRWGQTIFTSTDNKAEWDGTLNGVPQELGVYMWYLKYDCDGKTVEAKGDVTLIR